MQLAISIGDLNGIGLEIALRCHEKIKEFCEPVYCVDKNMLEQGARLLDIFVPEDFKTQTIEAEYFDIQAGKVCAQAGAYAYASFLHALHLAKKKSVQGIITLPINKSAWSKAGINFKGHTDALSAFTKKDAVMMLGCPKLFTILYTHHIPLKDVAQKVNAPDLFDFFIRIQKALQINKIGVLGLNPHAGDDGVIGREDIAIQEAIEKANKALDKNVFHGPLVPDTAFTPKSRKIYTHIICMYHDQGLIPLKTLYFDESINVSLDGGVIRTSVDHGTAFDIAYKDAKPNIKSYINAVKEAVNLSLR